MPTLTTDNHANVPAIVSRLRWVKFFSVCIAIVLGTVYIELLVRAFSIFVSPDITKKEGGIVLHEKNYDQKWWSRSGKKYIHIKTNSLGFMGREYGLDKPKGAYRIQLYGDSVVEGLQVDTEKTFSALLEKQANAQLAACRTVEVNNLGTGGTGVLSAHDAYLRKWSSLKPDSVVFIFTAGDVLSSDYADTARESGEKMDSDPSMVSRLKGLLKKSLALKKLYYGTDLKNLTNSFSNVSNKAGSAELSDEYFVVAHKSLLNFSEEVKKNGAEFAVAIYVPTIDKKKQTTQKKLTEFLDSKNIPYFFIGIIGDQYGQKKETVDGVHFNEEGHSVVAGDMYSFFEKKLKSLGCK